MAATDVGLRKRWMDAIRKVVTDLTAAARGKEDAELREKVNNLRAVVGNSRDACMAALAQCGGDFHAALDILLAQGDGGSGGAPASSSSSSSSSSSRGGGSSSAANRASSSAVEMKDDEIYPSVDARIATIVLPPDAYPGKAIEVSAPDGSRYRIVVPEGKSAGDDIRMRY